MNDRTRDKTLDEITERITRLKAHHRQAAHQLEQWSGGYPTGSDGPAARYTDNPEDDTSSPLDYGDRTGSLAVANLDANPDRPNDQAAHALHELDRLITLANEALDTAETHMRTGIKPEAPKDTKPGCRSCERITSPTTGRPIYTPAWRGDLCRWCGDRRWQGTLPALQLLRLHHNGRIITTRMIRKYQRAA